jgi:hypothetical protein
MEVFFIHVLKLLFFFTFLWPCCSVTNFFIIKPTDALISQIYFVMKLYMFWTVRLSKTCRVSWQNKFVKLVHLLGFIIRKRLLLFVYFWTSCLQGGRFEQLQNPVYVFTALSVNGLFVCPSHQFKLRKFWLSFNRISYTRFLNFIQLVIISRWMCCSVIWYDCQDTLQGSLWLCLRITPKVFVQYKVPGYLNVQSDNITASQWAVLQPDRTVQFVCLTASKTFVCLTASKTFVCLTASKTFVWLTWSSNRSILGVLCQCGEACRKWTVFTADVKNAWSSTSML